MKKKILVVSCFCLSVGLSAQPSGGDTGGGSDSGDGGDQFACVTFGSNEQQTEIDGYTLVQRSIHKDCKSSMWAIKEF